MGIYLHELVNVVPTRAEDYLDSMAEHHGSQRQARGEAAIVRFVMGVGLRSRPVP